MEESLNLVNCGVQLSNLSTSILLNCPQPLHDFAKIRHNLEICRLINWCGKTLLTLLNKLENTVFTSLSIHFYSQHHLHEFIHQLFVASVIWKWTGNIHFSNHWYQWLLLPPTRHFASEKKSLYNQIQYYIISIVFSNGTS